ncbi:MULTISPECIES: hypothetical protein [Kordiimonas]|jgi:hypothetical protein|uniref:Uncharacterized protein n=1 Tax=Kordiimonas lacus TaxID=637679 RepID=A0A1G6XW92_9PROT|nr:MULTISPECIES: hypothetical protein [Kordiimonas]SDD82251.1 hypothetical protein SAMN04488071_1388 [Kordiimonas lacus]
MLEKFRSLAIGLCLFVIVIGLAVYFMVQIGGGDSLFGDESGTLETVEFETLPFDGDETGYLLCPGTLCKAATTNGPAARFEVDAGTLRLALADYVDNMPTIRTYSFDPVNNQFDFLERLPGESIPAVLTVRILDIDGYSSSLVIYSRKPIGDSKPGEHEKRVTRWLTILTSRLAS